VSLSREGQRGNPLGARREDGLEKHEGKGNRSHEKKNPTPRGDWIEEEEREEKRQPYPKKPEKPFSG